MILKADHIVKYYGNRAVVDGVSLEVKQGEIVGLLGPNGAGKTTLFYIIVGLLNVSQCHLKHVAGNHPQVVHQAFLAGIHPHHLLGNQTLQS